MNENKEKTEKMPDSYRTGDVQPPKNYRGIITLLLLLVIFLGSLVSSLSFANVHLFRLLQDTDDTTVRFIEDMQLSQVSVPSGYIEVNGLGIEGCFLSDFDQSYFDLPEGIYITKTSEYAPGIRTGDILLRINGAPVTDQAALNALLESHSAGAAIALDIYRDGNHRTLTAILDKSNGS